MPAPRYPYSDILCENAFDHFVEKVIEGVQQDEEFRPSFDINENWIERNAFDGYLEDWYKLDENQKGQVIDDVVEEARRYFEQ